MQYVGIQTQQSRNNIRSAFLLILFPCLVTALLYLSCYLLILFGYGKSMEVEMMPMVNPLFPTLYFRSGGNLVSYRLLGKYENH